MDAQQRRKQVIFRTVEIEDCPPPERLGRRYHLAASKSTKHALGSLDGLAQSADQRTNRGAALGIVVANEERYPHSCWRRGSIASSSEAESTGNSGKTRATVDRCQSLTPKALA